MRTTTRTPHTRTRGFALLIAVIFMAVMLTFGLALGSLAYKQEVLASSAISSQYAFYSADAALECALFADQQSDAFDYTTHNAGSPPGPLVCGGTSNALIGSSYSYTTGGAGKLTAPYRISLYGGTRCADVTIYKYGQPQAADANRTTYIFSQGYDVPCSTVASPATSRFAARGLEAHY